MFVPWFWDSGKNQFGNLCVGKRDPILVPLTGLKMGSLKKTV
jgi:hypothetical protein